VNGGEGATAARRHHPAPALHRAGGGEAASAAEILEDAEASVVDLIDHLLNQGVVLNAEVVLGLAGVDLVYLRLSALLCAADRVLPKVTGE
jgi:hypothetical protein